MNQSGDWEKIQASIHSFQICPCIEAEIGTEQRAHRE